MRCPVCGDEYQTEWTWQAGERPNGEEFPAGVGFVHRAATMNTRREYEELGRDVYDGNACYLFVDGETETGGHPPQPTVPEHEASA